MKWGSLKKTVLPATQLLVKDVVDFGSLCADAKVLIAELLISASCQRLGAIATDEDMVWFLESAAHEIRPLSPEGVFSDRRAGLVRDAIISLVSMGVSPAIITPYLVAELEFMIRIKSRYLNLSGYIVKSIGKTVCAHKQFSRKKGGRVNLIDVALLLLLYRNSGQLAAALNRIGGNLPRSLGPKPRMRLAARLARARHGIMHGEFSFVGTEAYLFALLVTVFFYCEERT